MQPAHCYGIYPVVAKNYGRFGWMAAIAGVGSNGSLIVSSFAWSSSYVQKKCAALLCYLGAGLSNEPSLG